jgi:hypothetical protein
MPMKEPPHPGFSVRYDCLVPLGLTVSAAKTKKAAVTRALEEFIARRSQRRLVGLMGKLEWEPRFDYKAERS